MHSDGMFKELVENSDDILLITDPEFRIRYISSSVTKIFGISPVKLLGLSIFSFVDPQKLDHWKKRLEDFPGDSFLEEISLKLPDHPKVYFDVQVSNLLHKSDIRGLMIRLHDISAKKVREKELIRSNQQLDQVIYKTTHDLKAPLMSTVGLINLARKAKPEEKDRYLDLIQKSVLKLDSFIEEITDFFRNEKLAIQRSKIDIAGVLENEVSNLGSLLEDNHVDIEFDIQSGADFYSDSLRVRTIVTNILSNAIKYSDRAKVKPFIKISVLITEEFCELCFADNGIGIEQQYQDKIFDLFFRATTQSHGTGLGLFIVKDTVEKLKGTIDVNSSIGRGTTFTIHIPNQIEQPATVE